MLWIFALEVEVEMPHSGATAKIIEEALGLGSLALANAAAAGVLGSQFFFPPQF